MYHRIRFHIVRFSVSSVVSDSFPLETDPLTRGCCFLCATEHREANATAGGHPSHAVWCWAAAHQVHQHERTDGWSHEGVQGPAGDEHVERAGEGHFQREVSKTQTSCLRLWIETYLLLSLFSCSWIWFRWPKMHLKISFDWNVLVSHLALAFCAQNTIYKQMWGFCLF